MSRRQSRSAGPPPSAFVALDAAHVRTAYMQAKSTRLILEHRVAYLPELSRAVRYAFRVEGDSGLYEPVWLEPFRAWAGAWEPIAGWCPKGGLHDLTPSGRACTHMLAAAGLFVAEVLPALVGREGQPCPHPLHSPEGACLTCGELLNLGELLLEPPREQEGGSGD
jgi:hypothetical protein